MLLQPQDRYKIAVDVTVDSLVTEAVDQMMMIRKQKQAVTDESVRDEMEQQHSLDAVHTPARTLLAPLSTSTPADVCLSCESVLCAVVCLLDCSETSEVLIADMDNEIAVEIDITKNAGDSRF